MSDKSKEFKANVLIVEDDISTKTLFTVILESNGYRVVGLAKNGQEAVNKYKQLVKSSNRRPDIILMDQRMPLKTGMEATKEIIELDPNVQILITSGDVHLKEEVLAIGAVGFLKKPFDLCELLNKVSKILKNQKFRRDRTYKTTLVNSQLNSSDHYNEILEIYGELESIQESNPVSFHRKIIEISKIESLKYWFIIHSLFMAEFLDYFHHGGEPIELLDAHDFESYHKILLEEFLH